ncbi:MAG: hypothetical protein MEQ84_11230 [Mesorhizobium sp.]|nr:hypothetical protein [Mesorhizobium sp.]
MKIRLTTWNLEWFGQLLQGKTRTLPTQSKGVTSASGKHLQKLQRQQIAEEIRLVAPDILCIQEGPSVSRVALLDRFCETDLHGEYTVIKRQPSDKGGYQVRGSQGIWFLVRTSQLAFLQPFLLPIAKWREATEFESRYDPGKPGEHGAKWPINHPHFKPAARETDAEDAAGDPPPPDLGDRDHYHYRHPQVLVCLIGGRRVDLIGVHMKSKFSGNDYAPAARARAAIAAENRHATTQEAKLIASAEQKAVEARIKLSTEAVNVRYFIDNRFRNEPHPAVFLLGDLNDGVGKEIFERKYLFHDLVSNLQGDVFFARRFLNHGLFDYRIDDPANYRWTVRFEDAWEPYRAPEILLDHIMFTQSVVGQDAFAHSPVRVPAGAGRVEHAAHVAANSVFDRQEDFTSDHRPVSVELEVAPGLVQA